MDGDIVLTWIGVDAADESLLEGVGDHLVREFRRPVQRWRTAVRPEGTLDARRGQHSSSRLLGWLAAHAEDGTHGHGRPAVAKVLALTDVDLFIPILTFVFGEAQLGGRAAVVSLARLGQDATPARLRTRLFTEAVHELGHTFGLVHCDSPGCAMARSPSLREVDLKGPRLCASCSRACGH